MKSSVGSMRKTRVFHSEKPWFLEVKNPGFSSGLQRCFLSICLLMNKNPRKNKGASDISNTPSASEENIYLSCL